jgi:hypothetical protein
MQETMDALSVFITWNGILTVLPVKISTLFLSFNAAKEGGGLHSNQTSNHTPLTRAHFD